ncbi:hypothetical protein [Hydrogenovibrio marinus]|uniref:Uncharacterized protein n=1 Tax=Hydrogenovibrio marinus TaxID=28885 RepID=A0A066ZMH4_HYDMR|nr:hypothetical protein [Hydrogenovibrio marinus]KDN95028.1 hypothetical protein EI16_01575 [Hydrogenovibrio marinus]BBN59494.1 hypothetical protein HVMH_1088 [Hydrogenovibrio marinus]
MKTQLIGILFAAAFSTTAFAGSNLNSFKFPTPDSATGAGFESWAKDVLKFGGPGGGALAGEAIAWVHKSKQIDK